MRENETLLEMIAVTAELLGTELSRGALLAMEQELERYPFEAATQALMRCRRELTGRLTLAAIVERLEEEDGRPGPDEAWAIALTAEDEAQTVVWSDEIIEAFNGAKPLLDINDKVGARMAFRQVYERLTRQARIEGRSVVWTVSLGWDRDLRTEAIHEAVRHRRLTMEQAQPYLPAPLDGGPIAKALLTGNVVNHPAIEKARLAELRRAIETGHNRKTEREQEERRQDLERRERFEKARHEALEILRKQMAEETSSFDPDEEERSA